MISRGPQLFGIIVLAMIVGAAACCDGKVDDQTTEKQRLKCASLEGDLLDAVDLPIAINSRDFGGNPVPLSAATRERLSKYDHKVQFQLKVRGVVQPFLTNGAKTIVPIGAEFGGTLQGALTAGIRIMGGEVGVINGEIFVSEGTQATVNGVECMYKQGQ